MSAADDEDFGGPEAEMHLVPIWVLRLNKRDALLLLKALGGLLKDKEIEEARQLGDRLTSQHSDETLRVALKARLHPQGEDA